MTFAFRDYQKEIINEWSDLIRRTWLCYLAMEVRTGKTLTSLWIMEKVWCKRVLFITKRKVIDSKSISDDYMMLNPSFSLEQSTNHYRTIAKHIDTKYDGIIIDEAHWFGAYPKMWAATKNLKKLIAYSDPKAIILMSGTPTPESYPQIFHQFHITGKWPFRDYKNFYRRADKFVKPRKIKIHTGQLVPDYSHGKWNLIEPSIKPYMISYTQKESWFINTIHEHEHFVPLSALNETCIKIMESDGVLKGKSGTATADSAVSKMNKVHQLCSWTIKLDDGKAVTIWLDKAHYIKKTFKDKKMLIFYKFVQELEWLKHVFGKELTTDIDEFRKTSKHMAIQIVSWREWISFKEADIIVYYSIDFSATSYRQSRDRLTTKTRKEVHIHWIFWENTMEKDIYKTVINKKNFTIKHFQRYEERENKRIKSPVKNN